MMAKRQSIVEKAVAKLDAEAQQAANEFVEAREQAKKFAPIYQRARKQLIAALGDHPAGVLPDGRVVTKKVTHYGQKTVADYPSGVVREAYDAESIDVSAA